MTGRKNHDRTQSEALHEYRIHEQIERGEKVAGPEGEWLDRLGPAAAAGRQENALTQHSGGRQGQRRRGAQVSHAKRLR